MPTCDKRRYPRDGTHYHEGFLDYPFHVMLQPHLYRAEHYPQCLSLLNRMMAKAYVEYRNALVVEHEGDVVGVALMHDRPIGFWPNFFAGGYQLFRYGTPRLLMNFSDAATSAISTPSTRVTSTGISRSSRSTGACGVGAWGVGLSPRCFPTLWQREVGARMGS